MSEFWTGALLALTVWKFIDMAGALYLHGEMVEIDTATLASHFLAFAAFAFALVLVTRGVVG